jgi:hypothetical protein
MEEVGLFYGHLVYFSDILWPYGMFVGYFPRFGKYCREKSGNPGQKRWT